MVIEWRLRYLKTAEKRYRVIRLMFKYPQDRITTSDGGHNLSKVQSSGAIQVHEVLHCCLQNIEVFVIK
jgi:hypothetical protein